MNNEMDRFHWHEALDRTYCIQKIIDTLLESHPVIVAHQEFKDSLIRAQAELSWLYCSIADKTNFEA